LGHARAVPEWILDSVNKTIKVAPYRVERIHDIMASLPWTRTRVSIKTWHKVLGELRSMTMGVSGSQGFFSTLQEHLRQPNTKSHHRLSTRIRDFMEDFRCLAATLSERPTKISELSAI
jgi:hypothetical protein